MKNSSPILVAGLGAVGSIMFARLVKRGFKVVCLTSERGCEIIRKKGLIVKLSEEMNPQLYQPEVYSELPEKYKFEKCFICTKSYHNKVLSNYLTKFLSPDASILLFQNGLNIEDEFLSVSEEWSIVRAISSIGSFREDLHHIFEKAKGETKIGLLNSTDTNVVEFWENLLNAIGLETEISADIQRDIWLKVLVNCTINPIGAITRLENGKLLKDTFLRDLLYKVADEVLAVIPPKFLITTDEAYGMIFRIAEITANNKCSMLQDILRGLETEIKFLNHQIVLLAAEQGLSVPLNQTLVDIITALEREELVPELAVVELKSIYKG